VEFTLALFKDKHFQLYHKLFPRGRSPTGQEGEHKYYMTNTNTEIIDKLKAASNSLLFTSERLMKRYNQGFRATLGIAMARSARHKSDSVRAPRPL
jgi:hypothetical protein